MALDPRRGAAKPTPRRARPRSCVWWFLFGAILGSFGVGLYWMTQAPGQVPPPVAAALPKTERPAPRQPSFQFEKILRETVVESKDTGKPPPPPAPRPEPPQPVTPEPPAAGAPPPEAAPGTPADTAKAEAKAKADAKAKAEAGGTYILQVGSFKTAKEADAMKAKLALRGVSTRVQTVTLKDGQVWHRVMTGQLDGKKSMESTRATLKKFGTEAVPVKLK